MLPYINILEFLHGLFSNPNSYVHRCSIGLGTQTLRYIMSISPWFSQEMSKQSSSSPVICGVSGCIKYTHLQKCINMVIKLYPIQPLR